jgi:hypothetical protein
VSLNKIYDIKCYFSDTKSLFDIKRWIKMPKKLDQNEYIAILDSLIRFPDGATLNQISQNLSFSILRRSLQRRLAILVKEGHLIVQGRSRCRKYQLALPVYEDREIVANTVSEMKEEEGIPLSSL